MFPTLVLTDGDLSNPFLSPTKPKASKLPGLRLLGSHALGCTQPAPLLLRAFGAAVTFSGEGGGNLTSLLLLKSLILKHTSGPWPCCVCRALSHKHSPYQNSAFSGASLFPAAFPHSLSAFLSLLCGCGLLFGHIKGPALAPEYHVNQSGLWQWTTHFFIPQIWLLRTWAVRIVCAHLGHCKTNK